MDDGEEGISFQFQLQTPTGFHNENGYTLNILVRVYWGGGGGAGSSLLPAVMEIPTPVVYLLADLKNQPIVSSCVTHILWLFQRSGTNLF